MDRLKEKEIRADVLRAELKLEFKKLQKDNEVLRNGIDKFLDDNLKAEDIEEIWIKINLLIDNEIEQEDFCNK